MKLGEVMHGDGIGTVLKSTHEGYEVGDVVYGPVGWQDFAVTTGNRFTKVSKTWKKSHVLGALGMPGATAYYGLIEICHPRPGETLFVSGAAGAVGSLVGQIAKIMGLTVIGSAGGTSKLNALRDFGFDHVVDYKDKTSEQLSTEIKALAPQGIDIYFENTGGPVSEAVVMNMNTGGRISVCGQINEYNSETPLSITGLPYLMYILFKQLKVEGFMVPRFLPWTKAHNAIHQWITEGKIRVVETETVGLENAFDAFLGLFSGKNTGKAIVRVA